MGLSTAQVRAVEMGGVPVATLNPSWAWLVALNEASDMPTDLEIRQLRSVAEYRLSRYREGYQTVIREKAIEGKLLYDGGSVTYIVKKVGDAWFYRLATWQRGPSFMPSRDESLGLVALLDRAFSVWGEVFPDWTAWKVAHPDLFPLGGSL